MRFPFTRQTSLGMVVACGLFLSACQRDDYPTGPRPVRPMAALVTSMTELPGLGGCCSAAWAINASGQVVGWAVDAGGTHVETVLWPNATIANIISPGPFNGEDRPTAINASGEVVGRTGDHAFLWQNGVTTDLGAGIRHQFQRLDCRGRRSTRGRGGWALEGSRCGHRSRGAL
jgi:probable HAF family extracellular repeat protein